MDAPIPWKTEEAGVSLVADGLIFPFRSYTPDLVAVTFSDPKDLAGDRVTFVFAGGLGFSSEPKTEGFALEINGKESLRFDMPVTGTWESVDKRVELRLDVHRTISVDQFGLFYLKVPRDMLKPGEPCRLGVRSLGTGSRLMVWLEPVFLTFVPMTSTAQPSWIWWLSHFSLFLSSKNV